MLFSRPLARFRVPFAAVIAIAGFPLGAQSPVPGWTTTFAGRSPSILTVVAQSQLADRSLLAVVSARPASTLVVIHTDVDGHTLGTAQIGSGWYHTPPAVAIGLTGDVFVASCFPGLTSRITVMKYDGVTGRRLWGAPFQTPGQPFYSTLRLLLDPGGDVLLVAPLADFGQGLSVSWLDGATGTARWGPVAIGGPDGISSGDALLTDEGDVWISYATLTPPDLVTAVGVVKIAGSTGAVLAGPVSFAFSTSTPASALSTLSRGPLGSVFLIWPAPDGTAARGAVARISADGSVPFTRLIDGFGEARVFAAATDGSNGLLAVASATGGVAAIMLDDSGGVSWGPVLLPGTAGVRYVPGAVGVTRESRFVLRASAMGASGTDLILWDLTGTGQVRWGPMTIANRGGILGGVPNTPPLVVDAAGDLPIWGAGRDSSVEPQFAEFLHVAEGSGAVLAGPVRLPAEAPWTSIERLSLDAAGSVLCLLVDQGADATPRRSLAKLDGGTGTPLWGPVDLPGEASGSWFLGVDALGNVVRAGDVYGAGPDRHVEIEKRDGATGASIWGPIAAETGYAPAAMRVDSAGDILVAEYRVSDSTEFLAKLSGTDGSFVTRVPSGSRGLLIDPAGRAVTWSGTSAVRCHAPDGSLAWGPVAVPAPGVEALVLDGSGNALLVGRDAGSGIVVARKLSAFDGALAWSASPDLSLFSSVLATAICADRDGNAYLASSGVSSGRLATRVVKVDGATGNVLWTRDSGAATPRSLWTSDIAVGDDGVVTAFSFSSDPFPGLLLLRFDGASGAPLEVLPCDDRDWVTGTAYAMRGSSPIVAARSAAPAQPFVRLWDAVLGLLPTRAEVPLAACGVPYAATFRGVNGSAPYMFALATGTLPPGLTLNASKGGISGAPTLPGTYPFRLRVTDANGRSVEADYEISVAPGADVVIAASPSAACGGTTLSVAGSWASYRWIPTGETTAAITVNPPFAAPYGVVVTDAGGCVHRGSLVVNPPPWAAITAPASVAAHAGGLTASAADVPGAAYAWSAVGGSLDSGQGTPQVTFSSGVGGVMTIALEVTTGTSCARGSVALQVVPAAMGFTPLAPCRLLDTRELADGPALAAGETRTITLAGRCGVPADASALALNVTAVGPSGSGSLAITPAGEGRTAARAVAVRAGRTRAVFDLAPLGAAGAIDLFAELGSGNLDLVLDVSGYFR